MDYITKCALQNAPLGIKLDSEIQLYVNVNQNVPYQTLYDDCLDHINNQMQIQNFSIPRKIHIQKTPSTTQKINIQKCSLTNYCLFLQCLYNSSVQLFIANNKHYAI